MKVSELVGVRGKENEEEGEEEEGEMEEEAKEETIARPTLQAASEPAKELISFPVEERKENLEEGEKRAG